MICIDDRRMYVHVEMLVERSVIAIKNTNIFEEIML